ncbi:MAG TPA: Crp/Fnr family transcriptional regulator [Dehalococcoidales bacterium]
MNHNNLLKQDLAGILKQSPIFAGLNNTELIELSSLAKVKRLVEREMVFWEGDDSDWFYMVAEGRVRVHKTSSTSKDVILSFFGPGEMFGEVALFENKPYPATAQAITEARLIAINKSDLKLFLLKHPEITMKMIGILSGRLREAQERLRDLAGERVEQRLARLLIRLAIRLGPVLPFTRQEISDMSGTTTETTIRILSQWNKRGITRSVRGKITIIDETKLKMLAEGPPQV